MSYNNILIFNENDHERRLLKQYLSGAEIHVHDTSRVLEAIHLLRNEDIGLVLASKTLNGTESTELKQIVESLKPGLRVLFVNRCPLEDEVLAFRHNDFKGFMVDTLRSEIKLKGQIKELKDFVFSITDRLLQLFEVDNRYFFNNDQLVAELSVRIARKMRLSEEHMEAIRYASLLKDIGKVGIQHQIFDQKRKFCKDDFASIRSHPLNSSQIIRDIKFPWNIDAIIAQHHENYDGTGYPNGLRGRDISIGARILHIADSFVAMTTDRPYRKAISSADARDEIVSKTGQHFDPEVVEAFISTLNEGIPTPGHNRRIVLVIERAPTLTALLRLSLTGRNTLVIHADSTLDAIKSARQSPPDVVIFDVGIVEQKAAETFYRTITKTRALSGRPFFILLPEADYPRIFDGEDVVYFIPPVEVNDLAKKVQESMGVRIDLDEAAMTTQEQHSGLAGSLEDFPFNDIVEIMNIGRKTALVEIAHNGTRGSIYIRDGNVIHAVAGSTLGKDAFCEMSAWESGTFKVTHNASLAESNITMGTTQLMLEAARLLDEKNSVN